MRDGDLSLVSSSLQYAYKVLRQRWDDTEEVWRDVVRKRFDEQHIEPIEPTVLNTLKAINRLSSVLERAREECS